MTVIRIQPRQPVAFIVYVPTLEMIKYDPERIERTLRSLEKGVEDKMLAYFETPKILLQNDSQLTLSQKALRQTNLRGISEGAFDLVVLAGSSLSEYVREIIRRSVLSDIDISVYADEESLLGRYFRLQKH